MTKESGHSRCSRRQTNNGESGSGPGRTLLSRQHARPGAADDGPPMRGKEGAPATRKHSRRAGARPQLLCRHCDRWICARQKTKRIVRTAPTIYEVAGSITVRRGMPSSRACALRHRLPVRACTAAIAVALASCGGSRHASPFQSDIGQICSREQKAAARLPKPDRRSPAHMRLFVEERLGAAGPNISALQRTSPPRSVTAQFKTAVLALSEEEAALASIIQPRVAGQSSAQVTTSRKLAMSQFSRASSVARHDWSALGVPTCASMLDISPRVILLAERGAPRSKFPPPPKHKNSRSAKSGP
jgi:hypothetical protein